MCKMINSDRKKNKYVSYLCVFFYLERLNQLVFCSSPKQYMEKQELARQALRIVFDHLTTTHIELLPREPWPCNKHTSALVNSLQNEWKSANGADAKITVPDWYDFKQVEKDILVHILRRRGLIVQFHEDAYSEEMEVTEAPTHPKRLAGYFATSTDFVLEPSSRVPLSEVNHFYRKHLKTWSTNNPMLCFGGEFFDNHVMHQLTQLGFSTVETGQGRHVVCGIGRRDGIDRGLLKALTNCGVALGDKARFIYFSLHNRFVRTTPGTRPVVCRYKNDVFVTQLRHLLDIKYAQEPDTKTVIFNWPSTSDEVCARDFVHTVQAFAKRNVRLTYTGSRTFKLETLCQTTFCSQ